MSRQSERWIEIFQDQAQGVHLRIHHDCRPFVTGHPFVLLKRLPEEATPIFQGEASNEQQTDNSS